MSIITLACTKIYVLNLARSTATISIRNGCYEIWMFLKMLYRSIALCSLHRRVLVEMRVIVRVLASNISVGFDAGLFCVEDPPVYLSTAIAYITIMQGPTCPVSCKHLSSLGTWLASAMDSSSCSELLASVHHYCLFATYTDQLSASS